MSIFIQWQEEQSKLEGWKYLDNGEFIPIFSTQLITKELRYSNTVSKELKEKAQQYIASDMSDKKNVKIVIKKDSV